ncbi:hypothetical protein ElyMa_002328500 [Elysia marginata]|uniref:Uncharacterized protein n=1 Tax=Elysia marginata TaxID=1093978 RepID=A0AAV4G8B4_9GAST|nr:hypothetical protein ElyMa_002328500 [Elysia marginata]
MVLIKKHLQHQCTSRRYLTECGTTDYGTLLEVSTPRMALVKTFRRSTKTSSVHSSLITKRDNSLAQQSASDLLSPVLFNIFLESIEVSTEKSKVKVNSLTNISSNVTTNGEPLKEVTNFKYLGATQSKDASCTTEVRTWVFAATRSIRQTKQAVEKQHRVLYKAQAVQAIRALHSLLCGCEAWISIAESEKRIQGFEMKCLRKLLHISDLELKTNEYVVDEVQSLSSPQEPILAIIKRHELA